MSIFESYRNLKSGKTTSTELTKSCLEVAKKNPHNSFISVLEDRALFKASESDQRRKKGQELSPLDGIPFSLKDLFITEGIRTTAGSKILYNYIPPYDGFVSKSLNDAGAVLVGKVGCDEFGMGSTNQNTVFGPVANPINTEYIPGGSSGASAVSVIENSAFFSIGTDTGGSVRQPANFCGIYGLKPTYGRVSRFGQIAYASSLDQCSPFAKTPLDLAFIMETIAKNDPQDSTQVNKEFKLSGALLNNHSKDLKNIKIGFSQALLDGCRKDVKNKLEQAKEKLTKMGAQFVNIELPHVKYAVEVYYVIATSEASANLARFDGIHYGLSMPSKDGLLGVYKNSRTEGFGEEVKRRILLGTFCLSSGYSDQYFEKACKVRQLISDDFKKALSQCDAIFSPVCATTAFSKDEVLTPLQTYMTDLYTIPVNLAGLPSIAIPWGKSESNSMPTGFQLIGKPFEDEKIITIAHIIENGKNS
jgi:aspartyl-tRNA(Asn)/glutamyl-tRNA(Gln) amidotransferase subunit A